MSLCSCGWMPSTGWENIRECKYDPMLLKTKMKQNQREVQDPNNHRHLVLTTRYWHETQLWLDGGGQSASCNDAAKTPTIHSNCLAVELRQPTKQYNQPWDDCKEERSHSGHGIFFIAGCNLFAFRVIDIAPHTPQEIKKDTRAPCSRGVLEICGWRLHIRCNCVNSSAVVLTFSWILLQSQKHLLQLRLLI